MDIHVRSQAIDTIVHEDVAGYDILARVKHSGTPARLLPRCISGARLVLRNVLLNRWALLGALNPFRYGLDAASLRLFHEASSTIGASPYDVIHAHFGPNGLRALHLRELGTLKGRIVTTFYGFDVSKHIAEHGQSVYAKLFARGELFIGISDRMRRQLIDRGSPPDRTLNLRLGIDLSRFRFRPSVRRNNEPVRILSVGRMVEKKGFETAIKAFALVANKHPGLQYRIVGSGPFRGRIEGLIASLGLTDRVHLLGDMNDAAVRACFDSSHIFLLASQKASDGDEEGLPQVLMEAQAVGLPVISTLHSGIPEAVVDGKSAFLVHPGDVSALAERLAFVVEHPECWTPMGSAGRAFVEEKVDIDESTDRLVAVYQQLLS